MAGRRRFRILALSGGGYLGLYTAKVLADLEARVGEPLGRRFDLIAGTSVGGILALALAFEVPMSTVLRLFVERGTEIFSPRRLPRGAVTRLLDLSRSVLGPKYSGTALRRALSGQLGTRTLGEAIHNVVVPAVNVTDSSTKIFKTPHAPLSRGDESVRAIDVAMATSAAPSYFPSVRIGRALYADGGLFAVAPDQVALHEARHFMGVDPIGIRMVSIGTAVAGYQPSDGVQSDDGAVGWLNEGRLILTMLSVQQQHVQAMTEDLLGDRYLRIDAPWPADAGLGIDVATEDAASTLAALAEWSLSELDPAILQRFL
ncbi:MAG: hypothetical protein RIS35_1998 [Pseudomonadota bacterium]|jgi:predicted acylesterase/phospholipase RssA